MNNFQGKNSGVALIFTTIATIVILGAVSFVILTVINNKRETDFSSNDIILREAAQGGIDLAIKRLWNDYLETSGNTTRNWASYRYYLDNSLAIPINEDLNFNGTKDTDETGNGNGVFETYPAGYDRRGWALLGEPFVFRDPSTNQEIAQIDSVHIARYDEWSRSFLTITSTAERNGITQTAVQIVNIGGRVSPHTEFAVLANNISCILCHAEFQSLNLYRNNDPDNYNTFDRIKVASLESMLVRPDEADSRTAGTLYTRGRVYKPDGTQFSASQLQSSTLKAYKINSTNGKIVQNSSGQMTIVNLQNAGKTPTGDLVQFSNLYMDYPLDEQKQTDGLVPNNFPAPFPDDNNNRIVDDEEFEIVLNTANGRISFENPIIEGESPPPGQITSGVAYGVPDGSVYTPSDINNPLPITSNSALTSLSNEGIYEGNLILLGTEQDPIQIERTVAVDGDLVIAGKIRGEGQLLVRGNVYVVGDVTYDDAPGEFGKAPDGTTNAFALVAGGSIMIGDYLTVRGVNHSARDGEKFPQWDQYSIHAREAHKTNSVTINKKTETLKWGYFDPDSVDAGQTVSGRKGQQYSFTTSELMLFNRMELQKALADSSYTPRFYGLRASQPDKIYIYDATDEHAVKYNDAGVKLLSNYLVQKGLPLEIMSRATYHYCNPNQNWISEDILRHIWFNDELTRPSSGRPFQFDGLLYSNNSIWCIVRSRARHNSNTYGKMIIRGGVVAADLGVFIPADNGVGIGLTMYYDPRVRRFLEITDPNVVSYRKIAFYFK
ncbi:MAG TPA: hypothetical protein PLX23_00825 [Candidatus Hydrogenedens sp.]|nr:hypothetical protein [Candidatus Hydrogenedens sp.]